MDTETKKTKRDDSLEVARRLAEFGMGSVFKYVSPSIVDQTSRHSFDYADLSPVDAGKASGDDYFLPDLLGGSSFSGGSVHKANYSEFLERFSDDPGVYRVSGGHGTYGVAIRLSTENRAIWATLESLLEYPVLDEERLSENEREAQLEAWENWVEWEYRKALENRFDCDLDSIEGERLRQIFYASAQACGEHWNEEPSGSSYWINVKPIAEQTHWKDLEAHGAYREF